MSQFLAAITGASTIPTPAGALRSALRIVANAAQTLALWHARDRERQRLLELDDRMLRDIGLTRTDVLMQASKPFWRA